MARLPDRFDLWVRRARACGDPERQADLVLGALVSLPAWHLLNTGTPDLPQPAEGEVEGTRYILIFSDAARVGELVAGMEGNAPIITIPTPQVLPWCLERSASAGLLINPGEDAAIVARDRLAHFHREWLDRRAAGPVGFWIPDMTGEEEDFWQQHGL